MLLFMIPCDSNDIKKEYEILLNELDKFNPDLSDKTRLLAITKSDLMDNELMNEIKKELPKVPYVFISAFKKKGLDKLKDLIWQQLTTNKF